MLRLATAFCCFLLSSCSLDWTVDETYARDASPAEGTCSDGGFCPCAADSGCAICSGDAGACACALNDDVDDDGVKATACGGQDCDDTDPQRFPGNEELCDGVDNDCDDLVDGVAAAAACPAPPGGEALCAKGQCTARCLEADSALNEAETACVPINHCKGVESCKPGSCLETEDGYKCDCPDGFQGDGTGACGCPLGTRLSADGQDCARPEWSEATPLLEGLQLVGNMVLAMADDGSAALVWGETSLRGLSYLPEEGWSTTVREASGVDTNSVLAEALPGGGAVCLTSRGQSNFPKLYSTILRPGGFEDTHQHDQEIWNDGTYSARLAGNGSGHVVATWYTYDTLDIRAHGFVDEFVEGNGWLGVQQQAEGAVAPEAAVDDEGRAVLAYADIFAIKKEDTWGPFLPSNSIALPIVLNNAGQGVGGTASLSRFSFDNGWSAAEPVAPNETALSRIDDTGRILTVWAEGNDVRYRYFLDGAWSEPDSVYSDSYPVTGLRLAMNSKGDAMIAWVPEQSIPMIRAQFFVAGLGWQFVQVVYQHFTPDAKPVWMDVKLDEDGNAQMAWLEQGPDAMNGPRNLRTATFR